MENTVFTQEQLEYLDQRAERVAEEVRTRLREAQNPPAEDQMKDLQEVMELVIMDAISQIQAIADLMRGFFPENDRSFKEKYMPDIIRRCGEAIKVITDDLLRNLDL